MSGVTIYTAALCGYCSAAKRLLHDKGVEFAEIRVTLSPDLRKEMSQRANGRTSVPQIFIGGEHIGGCDELHTLERNGKLDAMLAA